METYGNEPLRLVSLREQAFAHIRGMIIAGTLAPGQICSATSLAAMLGISATPVREAMLDLVTGGFVERVRTRGFRVVSLSDHDLEEIIQLRLKLEVPTLVEIAESRRDDTIDTRIERLTTIAVACRRAAGQGDLPRFLALDRDLHLGLLELSGNQRLVELVASLRDQTRVLGMEDVTRAGALLSAASEHEELLAAIRRRDAASVHEIATRHLEHLRGVWAGRAEANQ